MRKSGRPDLRRVVEGARRHLGSETDDAIDDITDVRQFPCGDAHNSDATLLEPGIAPLIPLRMFAQVVAYSINLNGKLRLGAIEIEHIRANRMLTAKRGFARGTFAEASPEPGFRR